MDKTLRSRHPLPSRRLAVRVNSIPVCDPRDFVWREWWALRSVAMSWTMKEEEEGEEEKEEEEEGGELPLLLLSVSGITGLQLCHRPPSQASPAD